MLRPAQMLGTLPTSIRTSVPSNVSGLATTRPKTGHTRIHVFDQPSGKTFPHNRFLPPQFGTHRANITGM
jgi:hypothetical protein